MSDLTSRAEWPMADYMAAWKTFRNRCNEDAEIAQHLLSRRRWPTKSNLVVCDFGCGDGRVIDSMLGTPQLAGKVREVRLLDPDKELLEEAERCLKRKHPNIITRTFLGYAGELASVAARSADVVLAVHVVYLMKDGELLQVLEDTPNSTTLYIVLDSPDSVFTALWAKTAPLHHRRAQTAHALLRQNVRPENKRRQSTIIARVPKVLLSRETSDVSGLLLSLMSYRDMIDHVPEPIKRHVANVLNEFSSHDRYGDFIECKSTCFEIAPESRLQIAKVHAAL